MFDTYSAICSISTEIQSRLIHSKMRKGINKTTYLNIRTSIKQVSVLMDSKTNKYVLTYTINIERHLNRSTPIELKVKHELGDIQEVETLSYKELKERILRIFNGQNLGMVIRNAILKHKESEYDDLLDTFGLTRKAYSKMLKIKQVLGYILK